jgi:hypothetical protein
MAREESLNEAVKRLQLDVMDRVDYFFKEQLHKVSNMLDEHAGDEDHKLSVCRRN